MIALIKIIHMSINNFISCIIYVVINCVPQRMNFMQQKELSLLFFMIDDMMKISAWKESLD